MLKTCFRFFMLLGITITAPLLGQDVILKTNGERIFCRITGEDSLSIYYSRSGQNAQYQLYRQEVASYTVNSRGSAKKDSTAGTVDIFHVGFQLGISNPVGVFGSGDLSDESSGLAGQGFVFMPSALLKVNNALAITCSYRYQTHRFFHELIRDQYNALYRTNVFSTDAGRWQINGLSAGFKLFFPVKRLPGFGIGIQSEGGLINSTLPRFEITGPGQSGFITLTQHATKARAFAFSAGLKADYRLSEDILIGLDLHYFRTRPRFTNIKTSVSGQGVVAYGNYTQLIETVNIQVGLYYIISGRKQKNSRELR